MKNLSSWSKKFFPFVREEAASASAQGPQGQKGIALLIAVMVIVVMMSLISEMIVSSSVQVELANGTRDRIKAEYLAKSGLNLATFLLSISHAVDLVRANSKLVGPSPLQQDPIDGPQSLWQVANKIPPFGARMLEIIKASGKGAENNDPFKLGAVVNETIAGQMAQFEDLFSIKIDDEAAKININDVTIRDERVIQQLLKLFSGPVEKAFLEKKELTAEQLAYRILDFISPRGQTSPQSGLGDKDHVYQEAAVPYKAKKAPFDTLGELKLVAGWDDELHTIFSPYLTIYPFNKPKVEKGSLINLNTAPQELIASLIPEARKDACAEKFAQQLYTSGKKSENRASNPEGMNKFLKDVACYQKDEGDENAKKSDPSSWFGVRSKVFRLTISAETGGQVRELVAIVQKFDPKETDEVRKSLKEKRALRLLYWRFI